MSGVSAPIVAADVEQIALVGTGFLGAAEAELELEAVVAFVVVAVLVETDSAGEALAVVVGGTAALDEGISHVLGGMADSRMTVE